MGEEVDPARMYRVNGELDASGIYLAEEGERFCAGYFKPKQRQSTVDHQAMNAALDPTVSAGYSRRCSTKEPPLLFHNIGRRKFDNASGSVGAAFTRPMVARGAAYGDYDHDGDLDVLITTNHGPTYLFRNDGGNKNNWISIRTRA